MPVLRKAVFLTMFLSVTAGCACFAQNEYLSTLDYQNLVVNRIGNIPGISWVTDNSAYDQNHQRYFFKGNSIQALPFHLYTVDAVTGAVLSNPICPSNNTRGQALGLQYDDATDTLYAIYADGTGGGAFSWVEPATGIVHPIKNIPSFLGYSGSVFDTKDHLYVYVNGNNLLSIDAATGNILYNPALPASTTLSQLSYDNITGKLYGICSSPGFPGPQFDSISLVTGTIYPLGSLPAMTLPQIYAYTIDEGAGKYIFIGTDPPGTACIKNYLYILDINSGNILSRTLYPYAQNASSISDENVLNYCFDNRRGILYTLNWHPPPSTVNQSIHIAVSANPVCQGDMVKFTATPGPGVVNPVYLWEVNGVKVGTNSPLYSDNAPADQDIVFCILTDNSPCAVTIPDSSNSIIMQVTSVSSSLSITASATTICSGDTVTFEATAINGGTAPSYEWEVNGNSAGGSGDIFISHTLKDGDQVSCILKGSIACSVPVNSNSIGMTVNPAPTVILGNDVVIKPGESVPLAPLVTGIITSYQWTPETSLDNPSVPQAIATPVVTTTYQLTVITDKGCRASGKRTIVVYYPLNMPDAFTPNGDGKNDVFRIPPFSTQKIKAFSVFNRWGQRIFTTASGSQGWDGSFAGQSQPAGVYVWEIEYEDLQTGRSAIAKGTVVLVR